MFRSYLENWKLNNIENKLYLMRIKIIILFELLFSLSINYGFCQQIKNIGVPLIKNYSRDDYKAGRQNWSIIQDSRKLMYFGNNNGILEYDGNGWRIYTIPNYSIVRSLAIGKDNKIFVGAYEQFGYLYPDKTGTLIYKSLISKLNENDKHFDEIWKIHPTDNGIIFQSFLYVFKYEKDSIYIIAKNGDFHFSFIIDDTLYIRENGIGLKKLRGNKLYLIPGGDIFADKEVWTMFRYDENLILIGTAEHGLFIFDGKRVFQWEKEINEFFKKNQIFCGAKIDNNHFAFGTIQNGVIIINQKGEILQHINRNNGIQNNTVLSIYMDNEKNIWLGLDNGIDYIKINSPISYLNPRKEIGTGYTSLIYQNNLYFGTNQGLFFIPFNDLINRIDQNVSINLITNTKGQVWNLTNIDGNLLCGHNKGSFQIINNKAILISDIQGGWKFMKIPENDNYLIEGTYTGLILLEKKYKNDEILWRFKDEIKGFNESCRDIEIDNNGYLWISHSYKGIFKLKLNKKLDSIIEYNYYSVNNGLPSKYQNLVLRFKNELVISTINGFYKYNQETDQIEEYEELNKIFGNERVSRLFEDQTGNVWFFQNNELGVLRLNFDGTYTTEKLPFNELYGSFVQSYESILPVNRNNIIIGSEDGFIHFNPSIIVNQYRIYDVLIRKITTKNDSVVFGGALINTSKEATLEGDNSVLNLNYNLNALKIEFCTPKFSEIENIEYSYKLEGFDEKWSEWKTENIKEYSNLHEGDYIFKVKAKDPFNNETDETEFNFIILPPWYRSTWAYILYSIISIAFILIVIKIILRRFEEEKKKLRERQKKELKEREENHAQEVIKAEQEIFKLKNEKLEIDIQRKKAEVDSQAKELASIALQITYKNEVLNQIKTKLNKVSQKMIHEESKRQVLELIKTIEKDMLQEEDWDKFEYHFDQVHEDFIKKIKNNYPDLTPKDLKLCAYLRMNLATKEIAPLLNISVRGVEIHRYRLRKKINIDRETNLTDFLLRV